MKFDRGQILEIYTVAVFSILIAAFANSFVNIQTDDAFIFYTYVKNIVNGNGYVFNIGEKVNATTSVLYPLLSALIYSISQKIFASDLVTIPNVGYAVGIISLWFVCVYSMRIFKGYKVVPYIMPFLILAYPALRYSIGMETFLTMALLLATIDLYICGRLRRAAFFLALAVLSRPDALLLGVVIGLHHTLKQKKLPPWQVFAVFFLVLSPWLIFSLNYFGSILPSTLSAKVGQTESGRWGSGFLYLKAMPKMLSLWGMKKPWDFWVILYIPILILALKLWPQKYSTQLANPEVTNLNFRNKLTSLIFLRPQTNSQGKSFDASWIVMAWSLLFVLAYGIILNPPAYGWYYTPLVLPLALILSLQLEVLYATKILNNVVPIRLFVAFFVTAVFAKAVMQYDKQADNQVTAKYVKYYRTANWLNKNVPIGSSVAANEIGVLGYHYQNGKIIDALGLATPGVAEQVRKKNYSWYIFEYKPDYLVFNYPRRPILEEFVDQNWFKEKYFLNYILRTDRGSIAIYQSKNANKIIQ